MSIAHGTYKVNKKFDKFSTAESLINSEARTVKIFEIYHIKSERSTRSLFYNHQAVCILEFNYLKRESPSDETTVPSL